LNVTVSIPRATLAAASWTAKLQVWFCVGFVCEDQVKASEIASCRRLGNRGHMRKLRHIDADSPNHLRSKMRHPSFVTRPRANLDETLRRVPLRKFAPMSRGDTTRLYGLVILCRSSRNPDDNSEEFSDLEFRYCHSRDNRRFARQ
jgi:hypothetical protein